MIVTSMPGSVDGPTLATWTVRVPGVPGTRVA